MFPWQVTRLWFEDFSMGTNLFCSRDFVTLQDSLGIIGKLCIDSHQREKMWMVFKNSQVREAPSVRSHQSTHPWTHWATEPHSAAAGPLNTALFALKQASRLILCAHCTVIVVNVWLVKQIRFKTNGNERNELPPWVWSVFISPCVVLLWQHL